MRGTAFAGARSRQEREAEREALAAATPAVASPAEPAAVSHPGDPAPTAPPRRGPPAFARARDEAEPVVPLVSERVRLERPVPAPMPSPPTPQVAQATHAWREPEPSPFTPAPEVVTPAAPQSPPPTAAADVAPPRVSPPRPLRRTTRTGPALAALLLMGSLGLGGALAWRGGVFEVTAPAAAPAAVADPALAALEQRQRETLEALAATRTQLEATRRDLAALRELPAAPPPASALAPAITEPVAAAPPPAASDPATAPVTVSPAEPAPVASPPAAASPDNPDELPPSAPTSTVAEPALDPAPSVVAALPPPAAPTDDTAPNLPAGADAGVPAPALPPLPTLAPPRVTFVTGRGKAGAALAQDLARRLAATGVTVAPPAPGPAGKEPPGVHYYYEQDRPGAVELARQLAQWSGQSLLALAVAGPRTRPPGTLLVTLGPPARTPAASR